MAINSCSQAGEGTDVARSIVKMKGCQEMGESSFRAEKESPRKMWNRQEGVLQIPKRVLVFGEGERVQTLGVWF